jgi:hypothetical protein
MWCFQPTYHSAHFRRAFWYAAVLGALLDLLVGCSRWPWNDSTIEMMGSRSIFLNGIITRSPGSGEFLVIVELTPAEERDGDRMVAILRSGHPVSLRIREEADQPPILVSDVTSHGEAIIRCKTLEEANKIIDRLHAMTK